MIEASPPRTRATVAVSLLILALSGCPTPTPPGVAVPPGTKLVASSGFTDAPQETLDALKILGFEHVYAYTWQSGRLGGFVQFDSQKLDIDAMFEAAASDMNKVAKAEGLTPEKVRSRGLILFAIKPLQDAATTRECFFGLKLDWESRDGTSRKSGSVTRKGTGTIPDFHNFGSSGGSTSQTFRIYLPDASKQEVFEFRMVSPQPPGKS